MVRPKLVIFGERPGPNTDPERPLFPHTTTGAAARLIRLLGLTQEEYLATVTRYNVVGDFHSRTNTNFARAYVADKMQWHRSYDGIVRFVFCGKAAAQAGPPEVRKLGFGETWHDCMVIPHPSGRNRFYNSEASTRLIEQSLRQFARIF